MKPSGRPQGHRSDGGDGSYKTIYQQKRKQTGRWCKGKIGVEHAFIPHDKYSWVKDGKADYRSPTDGREPLELPWHLFFEKCQVCGKQRVHTVKRPVKSPRHPQGFDIRKRERDWELTKKLTGFKEEGEDDETANGLPPLSADRPIYTA